MLYIFTFRTNNNWVIFVQTLSTTQTNYSEFWLLGSLCTDLWCLSGAVEGRESILHHTHTFNYKRNTEQVPSWRPGSWSPLPSPCWRTAPPPSTWWNAAVVPRRCWRSWSWACAAPPLPAPTAPAACWTTEASNRRRPALDVWATRPRRLPPFVTSFLTDHLFTNCIHQICDVSWINQLSLMILISNIYNS